MGLREFDFEVIYRRGNKHLATDGLSRLDTYGEGATTLDNGIMVMSLTKVV